MGLFSLFKPFTEELVIKHIGKLSPVEINEVQTIHLGYISSRLSVDTKKRFLKRITYAEFCMVLERSNGPLSFTVYRVFGKLALQLPNYELGEQVYVRCIPVNDPKSKWFYVLEIATTKTLSDFSLKYKEYLTPGRLNQIRKEIN